MTTISLVSAALWSLPVALFVEGVPAALPDAPVLAAIVVLAVFNTAGANLMLFALVPRPERPSRPTTIIWFRPSQ